MLNSTFSVQQWLSQTETSGSSLGLAELLWYQRYTKVLDLSPKIAIQNKLAGTYLAKSKGRGMEFDEVRHYQNGDDVRTIDWRVTARTGKVHTKLFREEKERPVFILTELSTHMHFGSTLLFKSVQAAHLAALIAWHVKKRGDKLGGIVFSQQQHRELKPQSRSQGVLRYFHALTEIHRNSADLKMDTNAAVNNKNSVNSTVNNSVNSSAIHFNAALAQLRRLVHPGSLVYILSDFSQFNADALRHIQAIRQHNEVTCCAISDPLELHLPSTSSGIAAVTDGINSGVVELGNKGLQQRYAEQQQSSQLQLQQQLSLLGCKWLPITAAEPILSQLERNRHGAS
ncbi:DUF58 domain-containing protein [Rheinheimera salexigens]|uniref:DUF58 domain-containing protein n=1 Tax=Rheinheimera salexigens TaxID=1628148 RepID=A0A1E7Q792_9GAMM|nr:DUF58 domain-containing protein [Rheinheimera salexigens]OEY69943.1 hypothetical protein BI198_10480 [Rheinheimera salexigens]